MKQKNQKKRDSLRKDTLKKKRHDREKTNLIDTAFDLKMEADKLLNTPNSNSKNLKTIYEEVVDERSRHILNWVFSILVTLALASLTAIFFFQSVTMQESSMEPTLAIGDKYFMNRLVYRISEPERGDMIAFRNNGSANAALHIRRVIALPGETVQIVKGEILINGEAYREFGEYPKIVNAGIAANLITLEDDEYFVLGDNRNNSEDSRYAEIGNVNKKYIVGKLWYKMYPMNKIGFLKG